MAGSMTMQGNGGGFNVYGKIEDGSFQFKDVAIYNDMKFIPSKSGLDDALIDMADYDYFKRYLAGEDTLTQMGYLAADINDDKKVNARDFLLLKELLVKGKRSFGREDWRFLPSYIKEKDISLTNYNPVYDAKKFNGFIDFMAFAKGDLTETRPLEASSRQPSTFVLKSGETIVEDGKTLMPVLAGQQQSISSALLNLDVSAERISSLHPALELADLGQGICRLLIGDNADFNLNEPLFYINMSDRAEVEISGEIVLSGERSSSTIVQNLVATSAFSQLYPNPSADQFVLTGPNGSYYRITTVDGRSISTGAIEGIQKVDVSQWQSGMYTVIVSAGDRKDVHIFLKL